jgi:D-alanyl-D-alanine carboxypeptidase (penicillin-binding protein 5/6)
MLDYAFAQYKLDKVLSKDSVIDTKKIYKATTETVDIVPVRDVVVVHEKINSITPTYDIKINSLTAPIKKGDVVGTITIKNEDEVIDTVDLTVSEDINKANIFELLGSYLKNMVNGTIN